MITIEKGIPLPPLTARGSVTKLLAEMKAGDSVVVPTSAAPSWRSAARSRGIKVAGRKVSETETRIWRVS